jgi:hypothetical protein
MTNLTHLSDAELDAVTGGGYGYSNSVKVTNIQIANICQDQLALTADSLLVKQNTNQNAAIVQA